MQVKPSFITLLLLISFGSVNAVLFTPALPDIAHFFSISAGSAQKTITLFLVGYTLAQLLYGPIANRWGRKPALYAGISIQILSSLLCVFSGIIHDYGWLVVGRFMMALGSGVGLKMTFTLVNEYYEPKIVSQKISYIMLAFGITPGLGVALGGILNTYYGWMSCFYASAVYGVILIFLVMRLPETQKVLDLEALKLDHLWEGYSRQFKNRPLMIGGLSMGLATSFIYVFSAISPFIAINLFGMNSAEYGFANILPPLGLVTGSLMSAQVSKKYAMRSIFRAGIGLSMVGVALMFLLMFLHLPILVSLFFPTIIIYFGLCFVLANASTIAMSHATDKAHGSAVMSFMNMALATVVVLSLSLFSVKALLLPATGLVLCLAMLVMSRFLGRA